MSGDWMKVELDLPDKPEVHRIASILGLDADLIVGKLVRVWAWFDKHTEDGNALGVTYALVDRVSSVSGFAEAMALTGWLNQSGHTLSIPKFNRHNGKTAKNRALTAKRVASHKQKSNAEGNAVIVSDALPREEKRREDVQINPVPKKKASRKTSLPDGFALSDRVREWAAAKGHTRLVERLEHFVGYAKRSGKTYVDWDQALEDAIREDWAKLNPPAARSAPTLSAYEAFK